MNKKNISLKSSILPLLVLAVGVFYGCTSKGKPAIYDIKVEMRTNPIGIGLEQPRFMWKISSDKNNLLQKSYRIQVAESEKELKQGKNLLWDTGITENDQSLFIPYAGKTLSSNTQYFWHVKAQTNQGETKWSETGTWSTAFLNNNDWKAQWIGLDTLSNPGETEDGHTRLAARYLRKEFTLDNNVSRATLFISGLGSSETYINGKRISEDIFAPVPSFYDDRVYYNIYDVTGFLNSAQNTIGVVLGNGRYFDMRGVIFGLPSLRAQLEVEFENGEKQTIISDTSWKVTAQGPIIANNEFDGEEYDARLELGDWSITGYDDKEWVYADQMRTPKGELTAQLTENLCTQDTVIPTSIHSYANGRLILDMGQNMVGWLKMDLIAKKDRPVTFKYAETLKNDSTLYLDNMRTARVTDIYTPASNGAFSWEPAFVYHGFRFVEITGLDYLPDKSAFTGKVIYDKMETTGSFETSNKVINQIYRNAYWGIRGNYRGMPTDCPQRDERHGWLGDRTTGAYGESFIFGNSLLYNKWLQDIEDCQNEKGSISDVSPRYWTIYNDDVTWPAAFFNVANMLYRQYGDHSAIRKHYMAMKKWMDHMESTAMEDHIIIKDTYGDWCMPPESQELIHSLDPMRKTDGAILSTTVYYSLLQLMKKFAAIAGHPEDIQRYETLAKHMKEAYNKKFFNPATAQYGNNTVTANLLSLRLDLVPEGYKESVFKNIVEKTLVDLNGHVSTGVVGIQHLMRGFTEYGRPDVAYRIATNETYPSWGYMAKKGATTIWELWNGDTADPAMNSGNHVMLLGDLVIWFYENLAGIKCDPDAVGFKKIWMEPTFLPELGYVSASYESVYGLIKSHWTKEAGQYSWEITIPGNTTAVVHIPKNLNIQPLNKNGIMKSSEKDDKIVYEITSGSYLFTQKK